MINDARRVIQASHALTRLSQRTAASSRRPITALSTSAIFRGFVKQAAAAARKNRALSISLLDKTANGMAAVKEERPR